jgi:short-subunit dehydrogenase
MEFTNQIVLITGASSGIGKQLAVDFAKRRAVVIGCGRSIERLKEVLKEVRQTSPTSLMMGCDVSDPDQVHGMIEKILSDYGRVDILINNAGIGMRKPFYETDLAVVEEIMRINYFGAVYCTHKLLPSMIARHSGHIVNISSGAGKIGTLNMAAYCASKYAMNGWSESLYHELLPLGVKVSLVCPGPVHTGFSRDFSDSEPKSPPSMFVATSDVSRAVIQTIERDRFELVMPRWLALMCWVKGVSPNLFRYLAQRRFRPYVIKRS